MNVCATWENGRSGGIYKEVRSEVILGERDNPGKKWATCSKEAKQPRLVKILTRENGSDFEPDPLKFCEDAPTPKRTFDIEAVTWRS